MLVKLIQTQFSYSKKAIRIIKRADCEPTNTFFIICNALKFHDIVVQKTVLLAFKALHKSLPPNIQALFQIKENQYELRGKFMFQMETAGTNIKKRSPLYRAKEIWNDCQNKVKMCNSADKFKKTLKDITVNNYKTLLL